jgi:hypothetical protein
MTLLFNLALSRHIKGFGKPSVHCTERALTGVYVGDKPYGPNNEEVRNCLPHRYRKAFDRAQGVWWFDKDKPEVAAYCTLRDYRGRYLNTVYANAYEFTPTPAKSGWDVLQEQSDALKAN